MSDTQTWGIGWRACSSDSSGSPLAGRPSGRHRWWDWGSWYSGLCLRSGCRADSLPRRRSPVWTIWATPAPGSLLFQVYILQRAKQVSWSFWITNPKYDPDKRLIFFFLMCQRTSPGSASLASVSLCSAAEDSCWWGMVLLAFCCSSGFSYSITCWKFDCRVTKKLILLSWHKGKKTSRLQTNQE